MKNVNKLGSVIRFTFWSQARTKGFKIGTIFFVVLITIGIHVPLIIQLFDFDGTSRVGVLPSKSEIPAILEQFYAAQEEPEIEIVPIDDQGSTQANEQLARQMMFDGEIKGYLVLPEDDGSGLASNAEYRSKDVSSKIVQSLQSTLTQIRIGLVAEEIALSQEQLAELNRPFLIKGVHVSETDGQTESQFAVTIIFVFAMLMMLFSAIFGGGAMVASEVSTEKSSRVMEILITSVKPLVTMFGKVIGVFLVGFVQLLIYAATVIINLMLPHNRDAFAAFDLDLSALSLSLLVYFILFYLIGYFSYAVMFAAAGSIISRLEDLNQVISPIMIISLLTFYVAIFSVSNSGAIYVEVLSFVPLFTPVLMFLRIGLGDPALWEVGLAILINLAYIIGVGWLAAKIYRAGVLMYGKRPKLKEVWKAMRYN